MGAAALRRDVEFRRALVAQGPAGTAALAQQDPKEWVSAEVQVRRRHWASEAMREACPFEGQVGTCPECGGRAIVECGQSADFKKAKQYAHYTCMEERCGKVTHIKE